LNPAIKLGTGPASWAGGVPAIELFSDFSALCQYARLIRLL
jgi:hypothetical protein